MIEEPDLCARGRVSAHTSKAEVVAAMGRNSALIVKQLQHSFSYRL
jgi:hypothetical protein